MYRFWGSRLFLGLMIVSLLFLFSDFGLAASISSLYQRGVELYRLGKIDRARDLFLDIAKREQLNDEQRRALHFRLKLIDLSRQLKEAQASRLLARAKKLCRAAKEEEGRNRRAALEKALIILEKSAAKAASKFEYCHLLAKCLSSLGQHDSAKPLLERALSFEDDPRIHALLIKGYLAESKERKASKAFHRALKKHPEDGELNFLFAKALLDRGRERDAFVFAKRAAVESEFRARYFSKAFETPKYREGFAQKATDLAIAKAQAKLSGVPRGGDSADERAAALGRTVMKTFGKDPKPKPKIKRISKGSSSRSSSRSASKSPYSIMKNSSCASFSSGGG